MRRHAAGSPYDAIVVCRTNSGSPTASRDPLPVAVVNASHRVPRVGRDDDVHRTRPAEFSAYHAALYAQPIGLLDDRAEHDLLECSIG
jgi:hypothetical protein